MVLLTHILSLSLSLSVSLTLFDVGEDAGQVEGRKGPNRRGNGIIRSKDKSVEVRDRNRKARCTRCMAATFSSFSPF